MIRLTLIGILVFSGLLFLTGKNKPSQNGFVSYASFQGNEQADKKSSKTYVDTSAVTKSLEGIKLSLNTVYGHVKEKTVAYLPVPRTPSAQVSPDQKSGQAVKSAPVHQALKAKTSTPSQAKKRVITKQAAPHITKASLGGFTLPVRRPARQLASTAANKTNKSEKTQLGSKRTFLASFKSFIINTTTPKKVPQFKRQVVKQQTPPVKGRYQRSAQLKRSKKHIDPRLLTVLIKRELHRLNCYKGAVSAHWDQRIQARLKAINAPLNSNAPTLKTLSYLESKSSLRCKIGNTRIVKAKPKTQAAQQLKTALSISQPQFTLPTHKSRVLYTQSASSKSFQLRDRNGHLISNASKQTAQLGTKSSAEDAARIEAKNRAFEIASEGKDFSFSGQGNSMRPPAFTVGMRPQALLQPGDTPTGNNGFFGKPKAQKQQKAHKKKSRDWTKSIFSFD